MADFRIHEPGVRLDRAEELVEIIQEFLIFVEVLKLGQLVQMRKPQGLTGEVGGVVAESGLLHLDALLMAQRAAGVLVEFWGSGRQHNRGDDLLQDLPEGRGMRLVERRVLADQRRRDGCEREILP